MNKKILFFNKARGCLHVHLLLGMAFEVVTIFSGSRTAATELLALYLATSLWNRSNKIMKPFFCLLYYCN